MIASWELFKPSPMLNCSRNFSISGQETPHGQLVSRKLRGESWEGSVPRGKRGCLQQPDQEKQKIRIGSGYAAIMVLCADDGSGGVKVCNEDARGS